MPTLDLTDDEQAALTALVRKAIVEDPYPYAPCLATLKSALAKLDPAAVPSHGETAAADQADCRAGEDKAVVLT